MERIQVTQYLSKNNMEKIRERIIFASNKGSVSYRFDEKPELYIERVVFLTDNKEWSHLFSNAGLMFELKGFNKKDKQLRRYVRELWFGKYETVMYAQPSLEINEQMEFGGKSTYNDDDDYDYWILDITLQDLSLTTDKLAFSFEMK